MPSPRKFRTVVGSERGTGIDDSLEAVKTVDGIIKLAKSASA
jgi:hypothetical protein